MTDTADTAARRIARDLRLALPNSVRVIGAGTGVEFLLTRTGGRYRAEKGIASDDPLDFSGTDSSFDILGAPITFQSGDQIAIYNLGIPGADAYAGDNLRTYNGPTGSASGKVKFTPTTSFPFDSPGHRFQVVEGPVTYLCVGGELRRYAGYANQCHPAQSARRHSIAAGKKRQRLRASLTTPSTSASACCRSA